MYIQYAFNVPNGGTANFHNVKSFMLEDNVVKVDVYHYHSIESELLMWRDYYTVPLTALSSNPLQSIAEWLVGSDGYFSGGQIIGGTTELERAKKLRFAFVNSVRDEKLKVSPTTYGDFDSDTLSKTNLLGCIQRAQIKADSGENSDTYYRLANNETKLFTIEELKDAGVQVSEYIESVYATSWSLKDQIDAAQTVEEVNSIVWPNETDPLEEVESDPE